MFVQGCGNILRSKTSHSFISALLRICEYDIFDCQIGRWTLWHTDSAWSTELAGSAESC